MGIIKSTCRGARRTVSWFQNLFGLAVMAGLGVAGAMLIQSGISEYLSGREGPGFAIFMSLLGLIGLCFPIIMIRERLRDRNLMRWLGENEEGLVDGVEGPGGVVYRFDSVLVRYEANLSAIVLSSGFESGYYPHGTSHLIPKFTYTLFTALFGWWMADPKLWIENAAAIMDNLRDANVVTVAELFEPEDAE